CELLVMSIKFVSYLFFFQAEDGIRDPLVTGVQTCALPILGSGAARIARNSGTRLTSMRRPAPIWEPAPPETSARPPGGPVRRNTPGLTIYDATVRGTALRCGRASCGSCRRGTAARRG